jgi:anti-sigma factor RsiW
MNRGMPLGTWSRGSLDRHRAPEVLRRRVETSVQRAATRRVRVLHALAAGVVAAAALNIAALHGFHAAAPADAMTADVFSSHVRSLMDGHLRDFASSDREAVAAWFAGKLDEVPHVRDLASAGYGLLGGRLEYIGNRFVAAIVYRQGGHYINLLSCPLDKRAAVERSANRNGFNAIGWSDASRQYWAVADLGMDELARFVAMYRDEAP